MRLFKKTNFNFLNKIKFTTVLSIGLIIFGLVNLFLNGGPKLSIDFTGGTIIQIKFENPMDISKMRTTLANSSVSVSQIIEFGNNKEYILRTQNSQNNSKILIADLQSIFETQFDVRRVETVGPRIGKELRSDAFKAIIFALIGILFYIWYRFDRYYALGSVAALIHDVLITIGIFSILNFEIDLTIIAAFLTIVGYSLNDTIVVFDRIRENITNYSRENLDSVVNLSLNETLSRTFITSLTTLLVVCMLYFVGGEVIKLFALALIIGVLVGTYSSIYVASAVMIYFEKKAGQKLAN
ncbi:MAG: protein translocase subunit SecF [Candidatus Marinimicrobia bacterium]|nr:protein translocase subunit SecF [Candidatus Neomarinimicrobiota bacterium]|tara:strand:- start:858 stop:1748 length:891 start_codon:yes stop_codon:yes gene_type:complete